MNDLRATIERVIGIVVRPELASLEEFCRERLAARGLSSVDEYVALLSGGGLYGEELTEIAEHFAVRESHFFRDPKQLAAIERVLVSRFARVRRTLTIWVAACATGEEAYTLAMIGRMTGIPLKIVGTDVNQKLIAAAAAARYDGWSIRRVPPELLDRFFSSSGDTHVVEPEVRQNVEFRMHNLLDPVAPVSSAPGGQWDVVLCRNVLIYFDDQTVRDVAARIVRSLAPKGLLFVSSAESLHGRTPEVRTEKIDGGFAYAAATEADITITRRPAPADWQSCVARDAGPYRTAASSNAADADQAITSLTARHSTNRTSAHEEVFLAGLLLERKRVEPAVSVLERALARDAFLAEAHYLLGSAEQARNRLAVARVSLRKAVFLDPRFWPAMYMLASVLNDLSDSRSAAALYARAGELIEQYPSLGDRDYLPGVRGLLSYRTELQHICRRVASAPARS